jgi:hypothetical protein
VDPSNGGRGGGGVVSECNLDAMNNGAYIVAAAGEIDICSSGCCCCRPVVVFFACRGGGGGGTSREMCATTDVGRTRYTRMHAGRKV